jgi:putative Ca2+/H+ antiporter (TMEM165/GDT1 family)
MGDKTQLLALVLAATFRRPLPVIAGIFVATVANHAFAGAVGQWLTHLLSPEVLRWALGLSFIAMGVWTLIPDKLDEGAQRKRRFGAFGTTLIAFFLVEMGDKTQIATVALAARYDALVPVVMGTTLGMMIANVPAVLLGNFTAEKLPLRAIHIAAAILFALLGIAVLGGFELGL